MSDDLKCLLEQERDRSETLSVRYEDKLHRLRVSVLKALKPEIPRLEEALIALTRSPPKLHITDHYVRDTLNAVRHIVKSLECP